MQKPNFQNKTDISYWIHTNISMKLEQDSSRQLNDRLFWSE